MLRLRRNGLRNSEVFIAIVVGAFATAYAWDPIISEQTRKSKQLENSSESQQATSDSKSKSGEPQPKLNDKK